MILITGLKEVIFIVFLISGVLKVFLSFFNLNSILFDPTLLSIIMMLFLMLLEISRNSFSLYNNYIRYSALLLFLLLIWMIFSIFYTSSNNYVYEKIFRYISLLICFLFPILIKNFNIKKFKTQFVIIMVVLSICYIPVFQSSYHQYLQNYEKNTIYQSYLTVGYTISVAIIVNYFSTLSFKIKFINFLILTMVLLITGARGPLVFLVLIFIFYYIYILLTSRVINSKSLKILIMTIITFIIFFILLLNTSLIDNSFDVLNRSINRLLQLSDINKDDSANSRIIFLHFVLNKIDINNILIGHGFGSFGIEYLGQDIRFYPHNIFLEFLFELGLIGLFIFIIFLLLILNYLLKLKKPFELIIFFYLILNSLKSLSLVDSRIMFGFLAIILITQIKFQENNNDR